MNITKGCRIGNVVSDSFIPVLCPISTDSPSTEVQASSMRDNTTLMTYQLTGGLYAGS